MRATREAAERTRRRHVGGLSGRSILGGGWAGKLGRVGLLGLALVSAWASSIWADTVTAYCPCRKCTPGHCITASGVRPVEGRTIAGPRWVPFGTLVFVDGLGTFVVQDRMAKRYDGRWDLFVESHGRAKLFGKQQLRVTILHPSARSVAAR